MSNSTVHEKPVRERIALNSWTLDSAEPLNLLRLACECGYAAVELRMADFNKLQEPTQAVGIVRKSGLAVASLGADGILVQADATAQAEWFTRLEAASRIALDIGCDTIMVSTGMANATTVEAAAKILLRAGSVLAGKGLRLAYEFNAFHPSLNTLEHALALLTAADRTNIGLALDSYHMERSGSWRDLGHIPAHRLFCVQLSDVPAGDAAGQAPLDRLIPGQGRIDWSVLFRFLDSSGYDGLVSFEAPNPATWSLDAAAVAQAGLAGIRTLWQDSRSST